MLDNAVGNSVGNVAGNLSQAGLLREELPTMAASDILSDKSVKAAIKA
jgi:hypothetical protein